jgi:hypothetical protein
MFIDRHILKMLCARTLRSGACVVTAAALLFPISASAGYVSLMTDEGIGYFDYVELNAASTHMHYETDWTEWNRSAIYLFVGGQYAYYSGTHKHDFSSKKHLSTGNISTTSGGWHGAGWVAGSDMDIHIQIDSDGYDPWGDTNGTDNDNELLLIDIQKTDVSGAMSPTGSTLVLQFKIDIGNSSHGNRTLNRLWVKNEGSLAESATELTNGIVRLCYESGTNALSYDGTESSALLYGDYASNATDNEEFGHNALGITIPNGEGLNCYVVVGVLPDGDSLVGRTAQFKIIQDGLGLDVFGTAAGGGAGLVKIDEHINANVMEVPPALSGGDHRMKITFTGYDKGEFLTNFPALVVFNEDLAAFSYSGFASPNGYDLKFSSADEGTELNYEIETWSTTTNSYVWVQVPVLTNGTCIWAYWGDSSYTAQPESQTNGAVWDSSYAGVWHLEEQVGDEVATGTHDDSTANNNDGSQSYNGKTNGVVSGGQAFDGSDEVSIADANSLDVSYITASAWIKTGTKDATWRRVVDKRNNGGYALHMAGDSSGNAYASFDGNGVVTDSDISNGEWHQIVGTFNGTTEYLYIDGVRQASSVSWSGTIDTNGDPLTLGRNQSTSPGDEGFIGSIDEVRISNLDRGSNWVWASYMTVASNATFTAYGEVEQGESDAQKGTYFLADAHAYGDMSLLFVENFDNKSLGGLNMINDWLTSPIDEVEVQSDVSYRGGKALRLNEATAWHGFEDASATNVWVDFYAMPVQRASDPTMPDAATAGFYVNTSGRIVAYSNTTWVTLSDAVTISADTWYRFTLNLDYDARKWGIYVASDAANALSTTLVTNLTMNNAASSTNFTSFRMKN